MANNKKRAHQSEDKVDDMALKQAVGNLVGDLDSDNVSEGVSDDEYEEDTEEYEDNQEISEDTEANYDDAVPENYRGDSYEDGEIEFQKERGYDERKYHSPEAQAQAYKSYIESFISENQDKIKPSQKIRTDMRPAPKRDATRSPGFEKLKEKVNPDRRVPMPSRSSEEGSRKPMYDDEKLIDDIDDFFDQEPVVKEAKRQPVRPPARRMAEMPERAERSERVERSERPYQSTRPIPSRPASGSGAQSSRTGQNSSAGLATQRNSATPRQTQQMPPSSGNTTPVFVYAGLAIVAVILISFVVLIVSINKKSSELAAANKKLETVDILTAENTRLQSENDAYVVKVENLEKEVNSLKNQIALNVPSPNTGNDSEPGISSSSTGTDTGTGTETGTETNTGTEIGTVDNSGTANVTLPTQHTVVTGDNFTKLSQKYYGNSTGADKIAKKNNMKMTDILMIDQILTIPE